MKKLISVCLVALLVFSLCSCVSVDKTKDRDDRTTQSDNDAAPVITLTADKEKVSAGDMLTVTVNISEAPLAACYEISVFADERLSYIDSEECDISEMINEGKYKDTDTPHFYMSGMILTACDLNDNDMFVITYSVGEDVRPGDELEFSVSTSSFLLSEDETGNKTDDVFNNVQCVGTSVKVV